MKRPEQNEYADFYANYVALVEETDIIAALENQPDELQNLFAGVTPEKENYAYAAGKWNFREVAGHLVDTERVFSYRALRISRGDQIPLAGFDQDSYVANSVFPEIALAQSLEEFALLRGSNVIFFKNLTDEMSRRTGTASDNLISVRAVAYIMVGHVRHHAEILRTRYLNEI